MNIRRVTNVEANLVRDETGDKLAGRDPRRPTSSICRFPIYLK
jgi:hypothetical protein